MIFQERILCWIEKVWVFALCKDNERQIFMARPKSIIKHEMDVHTKPIILHPLTIYENNEIRYQANQQQIV